MARIDYYDSTNADTLPEIKVKRNFTDTIYFSWQIHTAKIYDCKR